MSGSGHFEISGTHPGMPACIFCGTRIKANATHRCEYINGKWTPVGPVIDVQAVPEQKQLPAPKRKRLAK